MKKIFFIITVAFSSVHLQSCLVKKNYVHDNKVTEDLTVFRIDDYINSDSQSLATIPWNEYFTDTFLHRYINVLLDNNSDIRIALLNVESSEKYLLQSRQGFLPTLSLSPGVTYSTQSLNTQFGQIIGERRHLFQYDLSAALSWEADIWGKIASQKSARQAQYLSTKSGQKAIETRLIAQLASMYLQLLSLDEQAAIIEKTIETRSNQVAVTNALFEAGQLTQVAVLQSEALYQNALALLVQVNNQIRVTEHSFNLLLNRPMQKVDRSQFHDFNLPESWSYGVPYQLLTYRPDVLAAEYNLIQQFEMTNVARAAFYPSLRITASSGLQSIDIDKIFNPMSLFANVVGSLTQPIFNQRNIRTNYEVSLNNKEIAYWNYRNTILNATSEVSNALSGIETFKALETIKAEEYKAYYLSTNYSKELLEYGMANYLEVLRAQENELNAALSWHSARYNKYLSYIQLYRALGGGWNKN